MQLLMTMTKNFGRSPHGERGLKLVVSALIVSGQVVALLMESVD